MIAVALGLTVGAGIVLAPLLLLAQRSFQLGAALCRASRDPAARRTTVVVATLGLAVWPLAWERLSVVGSHRQFTRDYGLLGFFSSPAFYSGLAMLIVATAAFVWIYLRIEQQTRDVV